ncbi:F5/8 type C domain protein [Striga asiatica]|uniref:F5/8 type C domain protein n=1 Tax=Striga asiatica TaxID=4170 RepID=A0A5A7QIK4_STRAF|nr:F5/8 type C domain protein [Striga asiatica]
MLTTKKFQDRENNHSDGFHKSNVGEESHKAGSSGAKNCSENRQLVVLNEGEGSGVIGAVEKCPVEENRIAVHAIEDTQPLDSNHVEVNILPSSIGSRIAQRRKKPLSRKSAKNKGVVIEDDMAMAIDSEKPMSNTLESACSLKKRAGGPQLSTYSNSKLSQPGSERHACLRQPFLARNKSRHREPGRLLRAHIPTVAGPANPTPRVCPRPEIPILPIIQTG